MVFPEENRPAAASKSALATPVQGTASTTMETERKPPGDIDSLRKSKGGKSSDAGKTSSGSANGGSSQSCESRTEASSDGSDDNTSQHESPAIRRRSFDEMLADGANAQQNDVVRYSISALESSFIAKGRPATKLPISTRRKSAVDPRATNLSIGMDPWNSSGAEPVPMKARPIAAVPSPGVVPAGMAGHEGFMAENQWMDERELKKWKRKQSNRESARRSRLRKQAECEELAARVHKLSDENQTLKDEIHRLNGECEKLTSENTTIKERLSQLYGAEVISMLELFVNAKASQEVDGNSSGQVNDATNRPIDSNGKHESDS